MYIVQYTKNEPAAVAAGIIVMGTIVGADHTAVGDIIEVAVAIGAVAV